MLLDTEGIALSDYNQTTLALVIIFLGMGVVGSLIGILWYRIVARSQLDRDTIFFVIKMFMGLAAALMVVMLIFRYM